MFNDQAHSLQYKWRDLHTLQATAVSGIYGKEAGVIKPFDNLKVAQLRRELTARGTRDTSGKKEVLREMLDCILKGVMRVPALLLPNPTRTLTSLNLQKYEVLASEPLHDLKGHLINLITELPFILPPGDTTSQCNHLVSSCLAKEKKIRGRLTSTCYPDISSLERVGLWIKRLRAFTDHNHSGENFVL